MGIRITKKIIGTKIPLFEIKNENVLKKLKIESVAKAKELYELYKEKDEEYFNTKVLSILKDNEVIIPGGNDYIKADDSVIVISKDHLLDDLSDILE